MSDVRDKVLMLIAMGGAQRDTAELIIDVVRADIQDGLVAEMAARIRAYEAADEAREQEREAARLRKLAQRGRERTPGPERDSHSDSHSDIGGNTIVSGVIETSNDVRALQNLLVAPEKRDDSNTPPPVSNSASGSESSAPPSPSKQPSRRGRSAVQACPPGEGVLTFRCAGEPKEWSLSKTQLAEWTKLYEGLDVLAECRKALAWTQVNPLKTASGMPRFLVNWLSRSNDRSRAQKPAPKPYRELPYYRKPEPI